MPYPSINNGRQSQWQYKHIPSLDGGINSAIQSDGLTDIQAVTLNNILMKEGAIFADTGYSAIGQSVVGIPQGTYEFLRQSLTTDIILVTMSTLYVWSTNFNKWMIVEGTVATTCPGGAVTGATSIIVASKTGFISGDLVGITLDNGDQLQATVTFTTTTFTLSNAIPTGRTVSAGAAVVRAVTLTGSADHQVSFVTIPGSDWMVFTNGVNPPMYYNGTQCLVIPNLPSAGNTICESVVLFNEALFLLNTTEGGTHYAQRCRRSDQTDPTNWTTGTAGLDDLYDSADAILTAELLGPYLIVYRDRGIVQGSFVGSSGINYYWQTMVSGEGALSSGAVANMGDYHIFIGHSNVYAYTGSYALDPIGDNIFYLLFGYAGTLAPAYIRRLFMMYVEELDEVWIFYVSTTSSDNYCDQLLRYNVGGQFWYTRQFHDSFIGYGFYEREVSLIWSALIGSWSTYQGTWGSRQSLATSPSTQLCNATNSQVYEYDYVTQLDNRNVIPYTIETKDFATGDSTMRMDMLEMMIQGTNILIEYSTDAGYSWNFLASINQTPGGHSYPQVITTQNPNQRDRIRVYQQIVTNKIRFRWTGSDSNFAMEWFGMSYKNESLY